MRKRIILPLKIAFLVVFAQLLGCQKFIDIKDVWHQHNPDCRIERITYHSDIGSDSTVAIFHYNNKGNPSRISFLGNAYPPDYFFHYDKKNRLTDYFGAFPNDMYFFWYHYMYDNSGRIIADTINGFGIVVDGKPVPNDQFKWHSVYEYDPFDRIKKVTITELSGPDVHTDSFAYNSAGNLTFYRQIQSDSTLIDSHDNRVSFVRTNKLWMFLSRNYSRNNLDKAEAYNSSGLPVRFEVPGFVSRAFIGQIDMRQSKIEYRCK
jgi:hypothetical protein